MIDFHIDGSSKKTENYLDSLLKGDMYSNLDKYGKVGVAALSNATPSRSGQTARSWGYRVIRNKTSPGIEWFNTNVNDGANIAVLIQYGHATRTGGYVHGRDYINPAMRGIFDQIASDVWAKTQRR